MPYNPIQKAKEIFTSLKEAGYEGEVPTMILHQAIMKKTHLIRSDTLSRSIHAFVTLGWLEEKQTGIWIIKYWEMEGK